jgi:hypothetical protein
LKFFGGVNERLLGMEIFLFTLAQWLYDSFNVIYGYPEVKNPNIQATVLTIVHQSR